MIKRKQNKRKDHQSRMFASQHDGDFNKNTAILNDLMNEKFRNAYVSSCVKGHVANQIRGIRRLRKMSQSKIAHTLQTGQSAISRMEDPEYGKMTIETLLGLARLFNTALRIEFVSFDEFCRWREKTGSEACKLPTFSGSLLKLKKWAKSKGESSVSTGSGVRVEAARSGKG